MGAITYSSRVERLHLPNGQTEVIATGAAWPRLSKDGTMLAYVTEENEFLLAGADGSNPGQSWIRRGSRPSTRHYFPLITASFVLVLSCRRRRPSVYLGSFNGRRVAKAHSVPSDWWCMPVDGSGEPQRLTNLNAIGLYGDFDEGAAPGFHLGRWRPRNETDGSDLLSYKSPPQVRSIGYLNVFSFYRSEGRSY